MAAPISADSLHRLIKQVIDSGAAASVAEAEALFRGYRLRVEIDPADMSDPVHQAALLTTVALGRRVFLGGVTVTGPLDAPLMLAIPLVRTLGDAVQVFGWHFRRCGCRDADDRDRRWSAGTASRLFCSHCSGGLAGWHPASPFRAAARR